MQSDIVEFVIGKQQKRFSVHALLTNSLPHEIRNAPVIEKVGEVVFGRCCEFLYSGSYSVPRPLFDPLAGDRLENCWNGSVGRWDPSFLTRNTFHPTTLPRVYEDLHTHIRSARNYASHEEVEVATNPKDDYSGVFLCHAEIYSFAYSMNWNSLCHLSLYRLIRLLANFTLVPRRTGDIVKLLQFVFRGSDEVMEDMKTMLRDYVLWNAEIMTQDAGFFDLLDEVPYLEMVLFRSMWA